MTAFRSTRPGLSGRLVPSVLLTCLFSLALLGGCGGGGEDGDSVLALVGDREVTREYYEDRLSNFRAEDLPVGDDGLIVDTATLEGKRAFLQVIINKELMALKAADLGFDQEPQVQGTINAVSEYKAGELMHEELIKAPAENVTDAQIDDYYAKLGTARDFHFLICNFRDDAVAAREKLLQGELWEDVAEEFNDGSRGPNDDYTVRMNFGRVEDVFEEVMFGLEIGEISEPLETVYGYWILRLDAVVDTKRPEMDEAFRERIRQSLTAKAVNLSRTEFIAASREKHEFFMDETALWTVYNGMPEKEEILDPVTQKPVPQSELQPLDVPSSELDRVFFSVKTDLDGEPDVWTVGDYKAAYDAMSVFARPKRGELLGGVRRKILADMVDRRLLISEARERGYFERREVVGDAREKAEQGMITKLHAEVVTFKETITPEEMDAFWAEHRHEYLKNEVRKGRVVYCIDRETADRAQADAVAGRDWPLILDAHGANPENKQAGGAIEIASNGTGSMRDAFFSMAAPGVLPEPVPVQGGWGVARLDEIEPSRNLELTEVIEQVGDRIKAVRKNDALNALLDEWTEEYGVTVHDDALAATRSWNELTAENQ